MRALPLLLLFCSVCLNGCKIVLQVPEGGTITTLSGEYGCGESETCEVDVDTGEFDETFTAVPNEGYEFRGWKVRDFGLCQREEESLDACRVSTLGFAAIPGLIQILQEDIPFYLEPEFAPGPSTIVSFPWQGANARQQAITVRGTARDLDGVSAVVVNGVAARLSPSSGSAVSATQYPVEVEWAVDLELDLGENLIVAATTDGWGTASSTADTVTVIYPDVPLGFDIDRENNRLIGIGSCKRSGCNLLSFDLGTETAKLITNRLGSSITGCFRSESSEYVYLLNRGDYQYELRSLNIDTLEDIWIAQAPDLRTEGFSAGLAPQSLSCNSSDEHAYLTHSLWERVNGASRISGARIQQFNLATGSQKVLAEFRPDAGDASGIRSARLSGDKLVAQPDCCKAPFVEVDTATGSKAEIETLFNVTALQMAVDELYGTIFAINFDAIYSLDPGATVYRILSRVSDGDPFQLDQARAAVVDNFNNRLLVSDSGLKAIVEVSLTTGRRAELAARRRGEGTRMVRPISIHITEDQGTAYAFDDGGNARARLLEIDLKTGDRRTVSTLTPIANATGFALAVDEESRLAYVATRSVVLEVNLDNGAFTQLASGSVGFGAEIRALSDLILDKDNNRLLLADQSLGTVLEMDLSTKFRRIVSGGGVEGAGPELDGVGSLALDTENSTLYAGISFLGTVLAIDLITGDRSFVLDSCPTGDEGARLGGSRPLTYLSYRDGELVMGDAGIKVYDVSTGQCTVAAESVPTTFLDLHRVGEDSYLMSVFGGLIGYDTKANDFVFVSE